MGPNDYGNLWSLHAIDWGEGNLWGVHAVNGGQWKLYRDLHDDLISINGLSSQAVYVVILALAVYSLRVNGVPGISMIGVMAVMLTLLPHTVLEVQPRYHHYIMPFIVLLAASGLVALSDGIC
jgi:hypothetical protein